MQTSVDLQNNNAQNVKPTERHENEVNTKNEDVSWMLSSTINGEGKGQTHTNKL